MPPHARDISSATNAEVQQPRALAAVILRDPYAHQSLFFERVDDAPGILACAVKLGGNGLDVFPGDVARQFAIV